MNSVCLQVSAATCVVPKAAASFSALGSGSRREIKHNDFFAGSSHACSSPNVPLTCAAYSPCSVWDQRVGFALHSADLRHLPLEMTNQCNKGRHFSCTCWSEFHFCSSTYMISHIFCERIQVSHTQVNTNVLVLSWQKIMSV